MERTGGEKRGRGPSRQSNYCEKPLEGLAVLLGPLPCPAWLKCEVLDALFLTSANAREMGRRPNPESVPKRLPCQRGPRNETRLKSGPGNKQGGSTSGFYLTLQHSGSLHPALTKTQLTSHAGNPVK